MKFPDISPNYGQLPSRWGERVSLDLTPEEQLSKGVRNVVAPLYKELAHQVTGVVQQAEFTRPSLIRNPVARMRGDRLVSLNLDNSLANQGEVTYRPPSYGDQVDIRAISGQFGPSDRAALTFDSLIFALLKKAEIDHPGGASVQLKEILADIINIKSKALHLVVDTAKHTIDITTPDGKAFFSYSSRGDRLFGGWVKGAEGRNPLKESISAKNYLSIVKGSLLAQSFFS